MSYIFYYFFQVVTFASNTTNNGDLKAPTLFEKLRKGSKATVTDSAGSHSPYEQRDSIVNHLDDIHFEYPFSELMIWAVLTKRQPMARLMWQHGEQAMAKALVASRLYQAMALEAADDDLDVEIYDELDSYSKIFEELSLQLLEFGYQSDDDLTQHLLTGNFQTSCDLTKKI